MPYPFLVCGNLLLEWCHKSDSQEITHCKSCEADVLGRLLSLLRWCQGFPGVFSYMQNLLLLGEFAASLLQRTVLLYKYGKIGLYIQNEFRGL